MRKFKRNNTAVSELLATVYVIMISTTLIVAVYAWAPQQINNRKETIRNQSMLNQFKTFDNVLSDLMNQGVGSSKTVIFKADEGLIHTKQSETRFVISHPTIYGFDFGVYGFDDEDDSKFTYVQENLPSSYDQLEDASKKINFTATYLDTGISEQLDSFEIIFPQSYSGPVTFAFNDNVNYEDYYSEEDLADLSWEWDFGDGTSSGIIYDRDLVDIYHEYDDSQNIYTISLTLYKDAVFQCVKTHDIIVGDETTAGFSYTAKESPYQKSSYCSNKIYEGYEVMFYDESSSGVPITDWEWDFNYDGAGTFDPETGYDSPNPTYTFTGITGPEQDIKVALRVTAGININIVDHTITVYNAPPIAEFNYPGEKIYVGGYCSFSEDCYDYPYGSGSTNDDWTWNWDLDYNFGDDDWSDHYDEQSFGHIFSDVGAFTIAMRVKDDQGSDWSEIKTHDVFVRLFGDDDPKAGFSYYFDNPEPEQSHGRQRFTPIGYIYLVSEATGEFDSESFELDIDDSDYYSYTNPYCFLLRLNGLPEGNDIDITHNVERSSPFASDSKTHTIIVEYPEPYIDFSANQLVKKDLEAGDGNSFKNAVQIDVHMEQRTGTSAYTEGYTTESVIAGEIFLFDAGSIEYSMPLGGTDRQIIYENGGIISIQQNSEYITDVPKIYDEYRIEGIGTELSMIEGVSSDFIMDIFQFNFEDRKSISAAADCRFNIRFKEGKVLENCQQYYNSLRLQILGSRSNVWSQFFQSDHDFVEIPYYEDTIGYSPSMGEGSRTFMLAYAVFDVDMEV